MNSRRPLAFLLSLSTFLLASGIAAAAPQAAAPAAEAPRYLRLVEEDDGRILRLEVAVRTFIPVEGDGPEISLAGAIHIAEASFYAELQDYLDELDLVVFESVRPAGTGFVEHYASELDDEARARITRGRLRYLAMALEDHFTRHGRYPADIDELFAEAAFDRLELIDVSVFDAWEQPIELVIASRTRRGKFDLVSLGADGNEGGVGLGTDLLFSDQPSLDAAELGEPAGIQKDLADAMGLVFQLSAMDHARPHWINRDLAVDQIEERLGIEMGGDDVLGILSGESMLAKVASGALRLVGRFSAGSAALKLVGLEVLNRADELLAAAPPELGNLWDVLIVQRNGVVLDELRQIATAGEEIERAGVIYGAGHMQDLEQRMCRELGYELNHEIWLRAVELDLDTIAIPRRQVGWIRGSIQKVLGSQLGGD